MHYFCNNLLDQIKRRLINYYLYSNKPGENLVRGRGETIVGGFSLTPWLIGIRYSSYITLCNTNTVSSNIPNNNNCNWHIVSAYLQKDLSWLINPKKFHVASWENFEIKGEKVIARIIIFLSFGVCKWNSKIFKLRNDNVVTILDEHLGFWSFAIFFLVLH